MKTSSSWPLVLLWLAWRASEPTGAMAADTNAVCQYTLLPGSQLIDSCPVCGRPDLLLSAQGTFQVRLLEQDPLFATYAVEHISINAGAAPGTHYQVTGTGTYRTGGEVAISQVLFLALQVDDGTTTKTCYFTNDGSAVERPWPMLKISLDQTNGTFLQQFHLDLMAAPFRELWFSTIASFHAGIWDSSSNAVSGGDLLSSVGRVVKPNQELTARLGLMPVVPDLGLDAVDVLPGGEIAFSVEQGIFSGTLGSLRDGDVLSDQGRKVSGYASLISAFTPQPPVADPGLDSLQFMDNGEVYFSIKTNFFSEKLGRTVRRGDLLSSLGRIVKTNEELLARFSPLDPKPDYGLRAAHVWSSGEVWFAVETGFNGQHFDTYLAGDLLSDQGYVVYHNLELVQPFQPLEDIFNFGLDALFVVSDYPSPNAVAAAPRCAAVGVQKSGGNMVFTWTSPGRVFQLEKANSVLGPWESLGPVTSVPPSQDAGAVTNASRAFYRLRQW